MFRVGEKVKYKRGTAKYVITKLLGNCARVKTGSSNYVAELDKLVSLEKKTDTLNIGEQIVEKNMHLLKYGDVIRETYNYDSVRKSSCYIIWKRLKKSGEWAEGFEFYNDNPLSYSPSYLTKTLNEVYREQDFSLLNKGILPQSYNDHKTYYMGHINVDGYLNKECSVNKYEDIKEVFENAEGWTQEVNEALVDLSLKGHKLKIPIGNGGRIGVWYKGGCNKDAIFEFKGQCEKNTAFKDALIHLLDKSEIGKKYKQKTKTVTKIQKQIDKLQDELDDIAEGKV